MSGTPESVGGYSVAGPRYIMGRNEAGEPDYFVQRSTMRGRPWLRFLAKSSGEGWYVTAGKTRAEMVEGRRVEPQPKRTARKAVSL